MSFQRVIPLIIIGIFLSWILYIVVVVRLFFGVFGSFNQRDLKQLIAYSSVYHLGWIMLCDFSGDMNWIVYLILYSLIIFPVIRFCSFFMFENIIIVIKLKYKGWFILLILRIAGIPPFIGFFLKWFAFFIIFKYEFYFIIFLIICSVVMFYVYFRVVYDVLLRYYDITIWGNLMIINVGGNYLLILSVVGILVGLFFRFFFVM